jgi:hypothetical protein
VRDEARVAELVRVRARVGRVHLGRARRRHGADVEEEVDAKNLVATGPARLGDGTLWHTPLVISMYYRAGASTGET